MTAWDETWGARVSFSAYSLKLCGWARGAGAIRRGVVFFFFLIALRPYFDRLSRELVHDWQRLRRWSGSSGLTRKWILRPSYSASASSSVPPMTRMGTSRANLTDLSDEARTVHPGHDVVGGMARSIFGRESSWLRNCSSARSGLEHRNDKICQARLRIAWRVAAWTGVIVDQIEQWVSCGPVKDWSLHCVSFVRKLYLYSLHLMQTMEKSSCIANAVFLLRSPSCGFESRHWRRKAAARSGSACGQRGDGGGE